MTHAEPGCLSDALADEGFLRRLCGGLGVAVLATDLELRIRLWNAAASRLFDALAEQMIGTPVVNLIPPDGRLRAERLMSRALTHGETADFDLNSPSAQGRTRHLLATVSPIVAESGQRCGVSLSVFDVTRLMASLNERNEARKTAALAALSGAVAHHFNNALGGVITAVDYVKSGVDPDTSERLLEQVSRSLTRATTMVRGLLAFSAGDRRSEDLSTLAEVLLDLAQDMESACRDRGVEFEFQVSEPPLFPVPRAQVKTILRNLLQNVIEAMPSGGRLTFEVRMADGRWAVQVRDTGLGLDEAARSRIFEPFWSTKSGLGTDRGPVRGFGLAIAHGLARILGATISVESEVNKGSCFTVSFSPLPCP